MFAQLLPGRSYIYSKYYPTVIEISDGPNDRIKYFKRCLDKLDNLNLDHVAMPYQIGCGLAGGSWPIYEKMLNFYRKNGPSSKYNF